MSADLSRVELFTLDPTRPTRGRPRLSRPALKWILSKARSSGQPLWGADLLSAIGSDAQPGRRLPGTVRAIIKKSGFKVRTRYNPTRADLQLFVTP